MRNSFISISLAILLFTHSPALAQEEDAQLRPKDYEGTFSVSLENDFFQGEDNNYTNGVRASFLSAENNIPEWLENGANFLPFFSEDGHKRWGMEVGQSMFTPSDIRASNLLVHDRPYAGWLYTSVGVVSDTGSRLDNLQLTLGVVGPSSQAAGTQDYVHHLVDSVDPQGWRHQLHDEPGIVLTYERKWRGMYQLSPGGWGVDATPSLGGSVGNIYTHASAGVVFRLGYDLPSDYGPPLIRPNLPGSDFFTPTEDFGWYLFTGVEERAVARNIFLDGNTWESSHHVEKENFVSGAQAGIAFTFQDTRIAYTHVFRTAEFKGQQENDQFGAITLSFRM